MQYFESSQRQDLPKEVRPGDSFFVELSQGERIWAWSNSIDSTGEMAVDSMGQGIAVQSIAIAGNGNASLGPVGGRVIVRVTAKTGYIQVRVSMR